MWLDRAATCCTRTLGADPGSRERDGTIRSYKFARGEPNVYFPSAMSYGPKTPKTVRLCCEIQGLEVMILVDSENTHNFIGEALASKLQGGQRLIQPMNVRIANGGMLACVEEFPSCNWSVQGVEFVLTLKVLSLGCYDLIMGMDWLDQHNPMMVHWHKKVLSFIYQGKRIVLQGMRMEIPQGVLIIAEAGKVSSEAKGQLFAADIAHTDFPNTIQNLLSEFEQIFAEPKGLPPSRAFNDVILLFPGV